MVSKKAKKSVKNSQATFTISNEAVKLYPKIKSGKVVSAKSINPD
ncbi:MAG: hypothetical protein DDT19_01793 [Syntrophomonadaceae bacterium]|nr:hypothetical protein [Bacillota bacterium]